MMDKLPYSPLLSSYSVIYPDDVTANDNKSMPFLQKLSKVLPHQISFDFILQGVDHDKAIAFYNDHETSYFLASLLIENSTFRDYECIFVKAPAIKLLYDDEANYTADEVINGTMNTSKSILSSSWLIHAYIKPDKQRDIDVLDAYQENSNDPFAKRSVEI